ncbi:MAG: hypothetical protein M1820_003163 [Bogoriella megaspora]|nr:MAG: hypothetical protein M1820_003163 [Bogoriella megaspora]
MDDSQEITNPLRQKAQPQLRGDESWELLNPEDACDEDEPDFSPHSLQAPSSKPEKLGASTPIIAGIDKSVHTHTARCTTRPWQASFPLIWRQPHVRDETWYLPHPLNLARARATQTPVLEENRWIRGEQNRLIDAAMVYLNDSCNPLAGMPLYYARKFGEKTAENDPFVRAILGISSANARDWFASTLPYTSIDEEMTGMSLPIKHDEDVDMESMGSIIIAMVDEGTARDDEQLLANRPVVPTQVVEHERLGQALTEDAPSVLYDPENRNSTNSSRKQPIAALQSMRRRRHLPRLHKLQISDLISDSKWQKW